jgi:predicted ester cyclase
MTLIIRAFPLVVDREEVPAFVRELRQERGADTKGDKVSARCSVRATHSGDSLGIEATDKPVEFTGITMLRVKDGQIAEAWNNFDFLKLFQQIGAM